METLKFKTTIKCSGCVAAVTPFLNCAAGENNWEVDTENPEKLLTIVNETGIKPAAIMKAVKNAGYNAEQIIAPI